MSPTSYGGAVLGRRPTPGEGQYSFVDTEEPTQPGAPTSGDRWDMLKRLFANLTPEERARLLVLADAWFNCDAGRRALLEATAREFAG
jgi:hypothetical protein